MGTMEGLRGNRHADSQDIVEQRGIAEKLQGTHFWFQASRWNDRMELIQYMIV